MIIIGYQGIGKSTIAGRNGAIDLESGNFWHNGKRPDNWYVFYCNIAEHLSRQGYKVLVSSHEVVRTYLKKHSKESLFIIHPSLSLQDEWIQKLERRYNDTKLEKDYKAWMNAVDCYDRNINDLKSCGITNFEIENTNYRLTDIIDYLETLYN